MPQGLLGCRPARKLLAPAGSLEALQRKGNAGILVSTSAPGGRVCSLALSPRVRIPQIPEDQDFALRNIQVEMAKRAGRLVQPQASRLLGAFGVRLLTILAGRRNVAGKGPGGRHSCSRLLYRNWLSTYHDLRTAQHEQLDHDHCANA